MNKRMVFRDIAHDGKCQVCGTTGPVVVYSSVLGAFSYSYCERCARQGYEPYSTLVDCVACCGVWPDDVSKPMCEYIRNNLAFHGKTEEEFANDVKRESDFMRDAEGNISDENLD